MADQKKAETKKIQRETAAAWWCPACDHSQTQIVDHCVGCGAVRDGDKVRVP